MPMWLRRWCSTRRRARGCTRVLWICWCRGLWPAASTSPSSWCRPTCATASCSYSSKILDGTHCWFFTQLLARLRSCRSRTRRVASIGWWWPWATSQPQNSTRLPALFFIFLAFLSFFLIFYFNFNSNGIQKLTKNLSNTLEFKNIFKNFKDTRDYAKTMNFEHLMIWKNVHAF